MARLLALLLLLLPLDACADASCAGRAEAGAPEIRATGDGFAVHLPVRNLSGAPLRVTVRAAPSFASRLRGEAVTIPPEGEALPVGFVSAATPALGAWLGTLRVECD